MASPMTSNPADRSSHLTKPSLLLSQTWHGNRVINAHLEDVGVSANGPASAPLSLPATAAPPAGAAREHSLGVDQRYKSWVGGYVNTGWV
jgi:hypothetical protein